MSGTHVYALLLALAAPAAASATTPELTDVRRHVDLDFGSRVEVRELVGGHAVVIRTPLPPPMAARRLRPLDPAFEVRIEPARRGGSRIFLFHRRARLRAASGTTTQDGRVRLGPESYGSVMRRLADLAVRPLPDPPDLPPPRRSMWREAERLLRQRRLVEAKARYERLHRNDVTRDLAAFRLAMVFVASGHLREAMARLDDLIRRRPRALASVFGRIWLHLLAVTTGDAPPEPPTVALAVRSLPSGPLAPYVRWLAANALNLIGAPARGLSLLPDPVLLADAHRSLLEADRTEILTAVFARAYAEHTPEVMAITAGAHPGWVGAHPDREFLCPWAVAAAWEVGAPEAASRLARRFLSLQVPSGTEARLVELLGWTQLATGRLDQAEVALSYLARFHPSSPDLPELLRILWVATWRTEGYAAALRRMSTLGSDRTPTAPSPRLWEVAAEIADAEGDALQVLRATDPSVWGDRPIPVRLRALRALAQLASGRFADAATALRDLAGRSTDTEFRDFLTYALAQAEFAAARKRDADRILDDLSRHGTRWGTIALARRRERELQALLDVALPTQDLATSEETP